MQLFEFLLAWLVAWIFFPRQIKYWNTCLNNYSSFFAPISVQREGVLRYFIVLWIFPYCWIFHAFNGYKMHWHGSYSTHLVRIFRPKRFESPVYERTKNEFQYNCRKKIEIVELEDKYGRRWRKIIGNSTDNKELKKNQRKKKRLRSKKSTKNRKSIKIRQIRPTISIVACNFITMRKILSASKKCLLYVVIV